jgi:hypothetical protein
MQAGLQSQAFSDFVDRRHFPDRRQLSVRAFVYGSLHPRRVRPRRSNGGIPIIDLYKPRWLVLAVAILLLSFIDATLTLTLLPLGAEELNPLMDVLIKTDVAAFAFVKMLLTGSALIILLAISQFPLLRFLKVQHALYAVLVFYSGLIGYELYLLRFFH